MKFFKSNNQKEYDGPAATGPNFRRHSSEGSGSNRNGHVPNNVMSGNGIAWSVTSSVTNSETRRKTIGSVDASSNKGGSSSQDLLSKSTGSRKSNSNSSSKLKKIDRSQPLASGISSRRTNQKIEKHQSAEGMTGNKNNTKSGHLSTITESSKQQQSTCNVSKYPMHHDGGVTCIHPLPTENNAIRFLSGGVDGKIQLWNINDPHGDIHDKQKLYPNWIKTYQGHRGYIHQIARLGWFDPKKKRSSHPDHYESEVSFNTHGSNLSLNSKDRKRRKELFVSASQDNTLRIWELDGDYSDDNNSVESHSTSSTQYIKTKGLSSKGKKLRGHIFGGNGVSAQGVLCVCKVPSLSSRGVVSYENADHFVSGGADGIVRVWDVRTALSLDKVPKSGVYSTVQIQCLEKDKISVLKDAADNDSDGEHDGDGSKAHAVPITSLVCTGNTLGTVALFAADANGTIRRYGPKNKSTIGYVNSSIWWEFTGYFTSGSTPVSSLTILNSPLGDARGKSISLLASASSGRINVWDASDTLMKKKLDESATHYSSIDKKKAKREAIWKIQLNDEEESEDEEESSVGMLSSVRGKVSITSLSTIQGKRLIAGSDDGKVHVWDVSTGKYKGSYAFANDIQIWSLAVVSEVEYQTDEEIINVGIIVLGDNRGRIRALKNASSHFLEENLSIIQDGDCPPEASHVRNNKFSGQRQQIRDVDFG